MSADVLGRAAETICEDYLPSDRFHRAVTDWLDRMAKGRALDCQAEALAVARAYLQEAVK